MIESLKRLSSKLRWCRAFILFIGFGFFLLFLGSVLNVKGIESDIYLIPSLLGFVWSLLLFLLVSIFPYVPPKPSKKERFFKKIKIKFKRFFYYTLAIMFLAITFTVLYVTFKLSGIWRGSY